MTGLAELAVERIREAYRFAEHLQKGKLYVCFSGGKDSVVLKRLCEMAFGEETASKCDFVYNLTTVDPPELVQFIKSECKDVEISYPRRSMWQLIPVKLMPPTRIVRYCCSELKEYGGKGRVTLTGVRWAESARRKNTRKVYEKQSDRKENRLQSNESIDEVMLNNDNAKTRKQTEYCIRRSKYVVNPIIDWTDKDVWEFIQEYHVPYCHLYDEGQKRLGCIGCPMSTKQQRHADFERYPTYKRAYIRAFEKMLAARKEKGLPTDWATGEEVFEWWINGGEK